MSVDADWKRVNQTVFTVPDYMDVNVSQRDSQTQLRSGLPSRGGGGCSQCGWWYLCGVDGYAHFAGEVGVACPAVLAGVVAIGVASLSVAGGVALIETSPAVAGEASPADAMVGYPADLSGVVTVGVTSLADAGVASLADDGVASQADLAVVVTVGVTSLDDAVRKVDTVLGATVDGHVQDMLYLRIDFSQNRKKISVHDTFHAPITKHIYIFTVDFQQGHLPFPVQ